MMERRIPRSAWWWWGGAVSLTLGVSVWLLWPTSEPALADAGHTPDLAQVPSGLVVPKANGTTAQVGDEGARFAEWLKKSTHERRMDGYNRSFEAFLAADPERALEALRLESDQNRRQSLLRSALSSASIEHIALIMASLHTLIGPAHLARVAATGIDAAVQLDPVRAIEIWRSMKDNSAKSESLGELSRLWPRNQDITPLVELEKSLEFPEDRSYLRSGMAIWFGGTEASKLREILERSELPASFLAAAETAYGRVLGTSAPVDSLISGVVENAPLSPETRRVAIERATEKRTTEMAEALLRSGSLEDLGTFGTNILGNLHRINAGEAVAWAQKLPPGAVADQLQHDLVVIWLGRDARAASEYGLKAPTERQRELAALAIADHLRVHGDAEGAAQWAGRIKSADLQARLEGSAGP